MASRSVAKVTMVTGTPVKYTFPYSTSAATLRPTGATTVAFERFGEAVPLLANEPMLIKTDPNLGGSSVWLTGVTGQFVYVVLTTGLAG